MKTIKNLKEEIVFLLVLSLLLIAKITFAQTPELVRDINIQASGYVASYTQQLTVANGKAFFKINQDGNDLGVYDGTTMEAFDINPSSSTDMYYFTAVGDRVYFSASTSDTGTELWMYQNGELTEIDINEGAGSSSPNYLTALNGSLYFQANDGVNGIELWEHDGTTAYLIDIVEGATGSQPIWLTAYGSNLVFFADDGTIGLEPYVYDGTDIVLIEDIRSGTSGSTSTSSSYDPHYVEYNGSLFFTAQDETYGIELHEYDGTDLTLHDLRAGSSSSSPQYMTEFNNKLYMYAYMDNTYYQELVEFDGTTASYVADIYEGSNAGISPQTRDSKFAIANGNMFFKATDGINNYGLYRFDGTDVTRETINASGNSNLYFLEAINDKVYMQAYDGTDTEVWEHDGTTLTEIDVRTGDESSSARHMVGLNGDVYFTANYGDGTKDWHLWKYDGTNASAIPYNGATEPSDPYELTTSGGKVYFSADDGVHGRELWSTDGTTTELVADQVPGEGYVDPYALRSIDDKLYYFGYDAAEEGIMYIYDGTSFESFNQSGDNEGAFIKYNGEVFFQGYSDELGGELYKYDGTSVSLVADIREGSNSSYPSYFFIWNSILYFAAADATHGRELWQYDGTEVSMVSDINPLGSSRPYAFTPVGSELYFIVTTNDEGQEVAKYDGTTITIIDIVEGTGTSNPAYLTAYNGTLALRTNIGEFGYEPTIINGENVEVLDINTAGNSYPYGFTVFKDKLYFSASNDTYGEELWVYDGTGYESFDLVLGSESSNPGSFFEWGPYLYFGGQLGENPYGMLRYDGVGEVEFLGAIEPEVDKEDGYPLAILDNYAYFYGGNELGDYELYRIRRIEEGNDILTFSLSEQLADAVIDTENHTVEIGVPSGTDLSGLEPTISISDLAEVDLSGVQDFSSPLVYTVTSEYGEAQEWTVTVSIILKTDTDILSFSFAEQTEDATIDAVNHTVTVEVAAGTDVTSLVPAITLSEGAGVSPNNGVAQDFTSAVAYTVTAEDEETSQEWIVSVSVAEVLNTQTDILSFTLAEQTGSAVIDLNSHTIAIEVAAGTDVSSLSPTITLSEGATISPEGAQDFTSDVTYTVTAEDGSTTLDWVVTVTEEEILSNKPIAEKLTIYPQPAGQQLTVRLGQNDDQVKLKIYDLSGTLVKQISTQPVFGEVNVDLADLSSGMWLLQIQSDQETNTIRFIKY